ncbi:MAG: Antibiotic biosynthesis monooxygenase [Burkholderiales bacterium]|jgi:quinol monooxygenase YgiN|nr:Antibiotic biosynthesis monooxygenase [Burkholderiales bacterium]
MSDEIIGVATFVAQDGKANELKLALTDLLGPTRLEAGCISYILTQNLDNVNMFTVLERFKDKDALDLHSNQPYIINFRTNILGKLVKMHGVSVIFYKQIG